MNKWDKMAEYIAGRPAGTREALVQYTAWLARDIFKTESFDLTRFMNEVLSRVQFTSDV